MEGFSSSEVMVAEQLSDSTVLLSTLLSGSASVGRCHICDGSELLTAPRQSHPQALCPRGSRHGTVPILQDIPSQGLSP
jgi:hypothetical protein